MKKISNLITYSILIFVLCDITWPKINSLLPDTIKFLNELFLGKIVLVGFVFSILFYICWKIPGLNFLLKFLFGVNTKLSGTWKGKMYCEYDNSYRDIYFTIIQKDAFTIGCNMYTENRESYSKNACIHEINGNETIVYQYFAKEDLINKDNNPVHEGTCILDITMNRKCLKGKYYTEKGYSGRIELSKITWKYSDSYQNAIKICSKYQN